MTTSRFKRDVVDVVAQMDRIHTHRESLLSSSNVQELEQRLGELARRADIFARHRCAEVEGRAGSRVRPSSATCGGC